MGVYLYDVDAERWATDPTFVALAPALNEELEARGVPAYAGPPPGPGEDFAERFVHPGSVLFRLFARHLPGPAWDETARWEILVPVDFDGPLHLPTANPQTPVAVGSAPRVRAAMRRLADIIGLPDDVPATCENLDVSQWFAEVEWAERPVAPGRWRRDLPGAFSVAMHLRGAEYALRTGRPLIIE